MRKHPNSAVEGLIQSLSIPMPDLSPERILRDKLTPEDVGKLMRGHGEKVCKAFSIDEGAA